MNQPIKFVHRKEFATGSGLTITMKALVTINGVQYVEAYDDPHRYPASQLVAVSTATGN